jgi:hypothetical protein
MEESNRMTKEELDWYRYGLLKAVEQINIDHWGDVEYIKKTCLIIINEIHQNIGHNYIDEDEFISVLMESIGMG